MGCETSINEWKLTFVHQQNSNFAILRVGRAQGVVSFLVHIFHVAVKRLNDLVKHDLLNLFHVLVLWNQDLEACLALVVALFAIGIGAE